MSSYIKKIKPKPKIVDSSHYLFNADCIDVLKQIPDNKIKLVITDPPYNIGLKYNNYKDNKKWDIYYKDLEERIIEIQRILSDDGSLYIINYPEINAKVLPIIEKTGLFFRRWLTWHYPSNMGHSNTNYTRTQRSILFFTKTKNNLFNKEDIVQPYKNPNVSKIKKLIENGKKGRTPYDALSIDDIKEIFNEDEVFNDYRSDFLNFNLLKNTARDRELNHPCQLPLSLLKVFIKASSNKDDFVLDCYAGTFTTSAAAKQLGRKSIGIEIDNQYMEYGLERLENG